MRQARPGNKISFLVEGKVLPFDDGVKNIGNGLRLSPSMQDFYLFVKDDNLDRTHMLWAHSHCRTDRPYKIIEAKYQIGDLWASEGSTYCCLMMGTELFLYNVESGVSFRSGTFDVVRKDAYLLYRPPSQ